MTVQRMQTLLRPASMGLNTRLSPYLLPSARATELAGLCFSQSGALAHSKGRWSVYDFGTTSLYGIAPVDVRLAGGQSRVGLLCHAGTVYLLYNGSTINCGSLADTSTFQATNVGDQVYLTGGGKPKTLYYDGSGWTMTDVGVEGPSSSPTCSSSATGGQLEDGSYLVCYRYLNSKSGHRSKPSPLEKVVLNGGGTAQKITVTVDGTGATGVDKIEVFRTTANGSILWLDETVDNPGSGNSTDVDVGVDTNDLSIGIGRYWEEWLHESDWHNEPPPKCLYICYYQGIVFCGGRAGTTSSLPDAEIAFSVPDFPYSFPADHRWSAGASEKSCTGFAVVGDSLYIMFTSSIAKAQRVGNQIAFIGNVFGEGIGCLWPNSLISGGDFAAFFGRDTAYLLTAAGIRNIGQEVADIIQSLDEDTSPIACGYEPKYKELWWYFSDGYAAGWALVYSLVEGVWRKELLRNADYACTASRRAEDDDATGTALYVASGNHIFAESRGEYGGPHSDSNTLCGEITSVGKQVVDANADFGTYRGMAVYVLSGDNAGVSRIITSNTATSLTTEDFPNLFAIGDKYVIAPVPWVLKLRPIAPKFGDRAMVDTVGLDTDGDESDYPITVEAYVETSETPSATATLYRSDDERKCYAPLSTQGRALSLRFSSFYPMGWFRINEVVARIKVIGASKVEA